MPDDNGNTPFHFAVIPRPEFEYFQVNNLLPELDLKKNIRNFKGRTAFHDACFYYNPWVVSKLMSFSDIDINITDHGGENALHHIIQGYIKNPRNDDCLKAIHLLLKKTPFLVNMKNSAFETPLHYVRLMNKDRGGMIWIMMNGKERKIDCRGIDRKFWATLLTTLEHYQKQARLDIFNYFIKSNNIN
jgi:ankyrin repeat protein